jgi:hypothetical protein
MWWVPAGARPSMDEGVARRDHLMAHGPSDHAFGWEHLSAAQYWKSARRSAPKMHSREHAA